MRKKILVDGKETNYEISDMGEVFNLKTTDHIHPHKQAPIDIDIIKKNAKETLL